MSHQNIEPVLCIHCGEPISLFGSLWRDGGKVFPQYCRSEFGGKLHSPKRKRNGPEAMSQQEELMAVVRELREWNGRDCNAGRSVAVDKWADRLEDIAKAAQGEEPVAWLHRTSSNRIECNYRGLLCPVDANELPHDIVAELPLNKSVALYRSSPPSPSAQVLVEALSKIVKELGPTPDWEWWADETDQGMSDALRNATETLTTWRRQHGQE